MSYYTDEIVLFEGVNYKVLDVDKLDFSNAKTGIKSAKTKVVCAKGGERIETKNDEGKVESVLIANKGDAIFCTSNTDIYIPHDSYGNSWKFADIEKHGYDIVEKHDEYVLIRSNNKALLLFDLIKVPTCIKNAWGEGKHQFLYEGAVIKKDLKTQKITGIDGDAFDKTWTILQNHKCMNIEIIEGVM